MTQTIQMSVMIAKKDSVHWRDASVSEETRKEIERTIDKAIRKGKLDAYDTIIDKLEELRDMPACIGTRLGEPHISIEWFMNYVKKLRDEA